MKQKLVDANILIEMLEIHNFSSLFEKWGKIMRYKIVIPEEIINELRPKTIMKVDTLAAKHYIYKIKFINVDILNKLNIINPVLSKPDCSILHYCMNNPDQNIICLTADNPLRKKLTKIGIEVHGFIGIFKKIIDDGLYTRKFVLETFNDVLNDPFLCPPKYKNLI